MNNMDLKNLKEIGLTEGEISVYSSLLDLGESTKTALAKASKVSPSNIYDITNRLIEKGIISKVEKNGVAHFSAVNPKHLLNFLEERKNKIDAEKELVNNLLPNLLLKFNKTKEKVNVEVFNGWNGLKTVFDNLLEECRRGTENFVFGASKGDVEVEKKADIFFPKYSDARASKGIITSIIFNKNLRNSERVLEITKNKNNHAKFLDQTTPAEIMLYKNITCIIILTNEPLVIRISGKEVFDSFKQQFDLLWKIAKS